jgi:hypothetical protein
MDRTILLPLSEESTGQLSFNVGRDGLNLGKNLFYGGYLGIFLPAGNSISLDPSLDSTPVIRDNVVLPDYEFMSYRALTVGADLNWNFRLAGTSFYLKALCDAAVCTYNDAASDPETSPTSGSSSASGTLPFRLTATLILGFRH